MTKSTSGKLKNLNIKSSEQDLTPDVNAPDALETITLRYDGRQKPSIAYAPDIAPKRFDNDVDDKVLPSIVPSDHTQKSASVKSDEMPLTPVLMGVGILLSIAWMVLSVLISGTVLATQIESIAYTIMPGFIAFVALILGGLLWRMDRKRTDTIQSTIRDIFESNTDALGDHVVQAETLTKNLADVQVHMRGVNNQFWALQKNIKDINKLKTDLEFLGQEVSTFSTLSRRSVMEWDNQMEAANDRLSDMERTTARLSHDSLETCSFLADRLEEVNEQMSSLNDLQSDAAMNVRRFDDVVRTARDDMKELISESKEQSESATVAQNQFRSALKAHIADLSTELQALGDMAKAYDRVRADMNQAGDVLSRGVRESLLDIRVLLDDWKHTKSQLELVLSSSKENVSVQFEQQLGAAKEFLSDWDYMLQSRLNLLTSTKETIESHLTDLPEALQNTSKAILNETPELVSQLSGFRHAAAGMQQSIRDAQDAAKSLSATTPDLTKMKDDMEALSLQADVAHKNIATMIETAKPNIDNVDEVTMRLQNFFDGLKEKTNMHMRQFDALEAMTRRFQEEQAPQKITDHYKPVLDMMEKLDERCDSIEKKAVMAREEFESVDIKPLMKSIVLDVEAVFDQAVDVLYALKPEDKILMDRDDLPALTIRLRKLLESIRPDVLASSIKSRPALNESVRKFTGRFGVICEQARSSSPQGEWVAASLASSELGKIYRALLKGLG